MTVRRVRSRDISTGASNPRTTGRGSVTRPAVGRGAVGSEGLASGSVQPTHMGRHTLSEANAQPTLANRETMDFETPTGTIEVAESKEYVVQAGGELSSYWTVTGTVTTPIEVTVYRNGAALTRYDAATATVVDDIVSIESSPTHKAWSTVWAKGDRLKVGVTDAGAGGTKLAGTCRFNPREGA